MNKKRNGKERRDETNAAKKWDMKGRKEGIRETRMKEGSWHLSM